MVGCCIYPLDTAAERQGTTLADVDLSVRQLESVNADKGVVRVVCKRKTDCAMNMEVCQYAIGCTHDFSATAIHRTCYRANDIRDIRSGAGCRVDQGANQRAVSPMLRFSNAWLGKGGGIKHNAG